MHEHADQNRQNLVDSGGSCIILNQPLALQVVNSSSHAFWVRKNVKPQLRTFSIKPIRIEGK